MKRLLVVVDYQNDFVSGALGFEKAKALCPAIAAKIEEYRMQNDEIVFTMDTHGQDYLQTQEGKNLPVEHCIQGTQGWELYSGIAPLKQPEDVCFHKGSFGSQALYAYVKERSYQSIELCGVVSNICVLSNAVLCKTAAPQTPVIVDANCTASNDDRLNEQALHILQSIQVQVINQ